MKSGAYFFVLYFLLFAVVITGEFLEEECIQIKTEKLTPLISSLQRKTDYSFPAVSAKINDGFEYGQDGKLAAGSGENKIPERSR